MWLQGNTTLKRHVYADNLLLHAHNLNKNQNDFNTWYCSKLLCHLSYYFNRLTQDIKWHNTIIVVCIYITIYSSYILIQRITPHI